MNLKSACVIATDRTWEKLEGLVTFRGARRFGKVDDVPWGQAFDRFIVDCEVSDLELWPLPALTARKSLHTSAFLLRLDSEALLEPISVDHSLFFERDPLRMEALILRAVDPENAGRIADAHLLPSRDRLLVHMGTGKSYLFNLAELAHMKGQARSAVVSDDGEYVEITLASGDKVEVPWDLVLYYCEPEYAFHKSKQTSGDHLERTRRIGERITELRENKGWTIAHLAKESGMLRPNLSRIESGKHQPSLPTLERVAEALQVPVAALIAR